MESNQQNTEEKKKPEQPQNTADEFTFEEPEGYDLVREKFEILGIKMDIHKNGVLYLKELVHFSSHFN